LAAIQEVSSKTAQLHCSIRGWATQPLGLLAQSPILTVQQAILDDSGKDELAPAFVIAGYITTTNDLMDLADRWEALLDKDPVLTYLKAYEVFGFKRSIFRLDTTGTRPPLVAIRVTDCQIFW
jgi:hypothetical protein